jgi:hypothetical protein
VGGMFAHLRGYGFGRSSRFYLPCLSRIRNIVLNTRKPERQIMFDVALLVELLIWVLSCALAYQAGKYIERRRNRKLLSQ